MMGAVFEPKRRFRTRWIEESLVQISFLEEAIMKNAQHHWKRIWRMRRPVASAALALAAVLVSAVITTLLSSVLSLSAQTTPPQSTPAQRPAKQPTPAAQAKPRYKGIWEHVNYT
jgi:type VI protein secretion system component VasF